jgi:hypothetical protein
MVDSAQVGLASKDGTEIDFLPVEADAPAWVAYFAPGRVSSITSPQWLAKALAESTAAMG